MSDAHVQAFVAESEEGITELNNSLLALEADPDDAEAMDDVFRTAHTLKGNAAAMGFDAVSELAHAMEDLLDEVRADAVAVDPELMDLLFEAVDLLEAMVEDVAADGDTDRDAADLERRLRDRLAAGDDAGPDDANAGDADTVAADAEGPETNEEAALAELPDRVWALAEDGPLVRATVDLGDADMPSVDATFVLEAAAEAFAAVETVPGEATVEAGEFDDGFEVYVADVAPEEVAAGLDAVSQVDAVSVTTVGDDEGGVDGDTDVSGADGADADIDVSGDEEVDADAEFDAGSDAAASIENDADTAEEPADDDQITSVRVGMDQLDDLYGQVEQLVTARIKLRREMEAAAVDSDNLDELDKITSNLQETVMDMRLIPLQKVVDDFPRLVRDVARDLDKQVRFEMMGTDIELDRTILTEIRDPLVHVLRNAVDHGIESPAEREAAGKDPTGHVTLDASRERDHVTVAVEDDGAGLDADELRETAVEKGVKTPDEVAEMADKDVYDLVFHPGFSTSEEVTDVSGRGVGMDVVHTTVKRLDGTVSVDSDPGEGTRVELRLPVTVAIVKVMFVAVDGAEYGVPVKNIAEVSRADDVRVANGDEIVEHDDDIYPVVRLSERLHGEETPGPTDSDPTGAAADGGVDVGSDGEGDGDRAAGVGGDSDEGMLLRIREEKRAMALHCDAVVDQEEVVVKPLEGVLSGVPGLSGTSVLGDGNVVPILDVVSL